MADDDTDRFDARAELLRTLMRKVDEDPFPSLTMLDQIESLLLPEEVPVYSQVLLAKIERDPFPSVTLVKRLSALL